MSINAAIGRLAVALGMALSLGAGAISAQEECSNADFKGRYSFQAESVSLQSAADEKYPLRFAGTVYADGAGSFTEWMDTAVVGRPGQESNIVNRRNLIAAAAAAGGKLTYEVTSDCRITIRGKLAVAIGTVDLELTGGLAHGGREARLVQTLPNTLVGSSVFKSMEPPAHPELKAIKELLDRVARRNGLRP
jgi:hypothetical protein